MESSGAWFNGSLVILALAGLLGTAPTAAARGSETLSLAGSLFTEYQSNVNASNTDPRSGMVYRSRLEAAGAHQGERYSWSLDGAFNFQDYQHNLQDERFDAEAVGNARWFLRRDSLDWNLDYVETVQVVDPAAPDIGSNTETVRLVGTGPVARIRLGGINEMTLSARRQRIATGDDHYFRNTGSATLTRTPRPRHQVFARADYNVTEYSGAFPDYRTRQSVAGYTYSGVRTRVSLEGGRGWLKEEGFELEQSDVGRVQASWQMSDQRLLSLTGNQEFSDEASDLESLANGTLVAGVEGTGAYRQRSAALTYSGSRSLLDPLVTVWGKQRRYLLSVGSRRDTDEYGSRFLTRLFEADTGFVSSALSYTRREFLDNGRVDRDRQALVSATRLLTDRADLTLGVSWFERASSEPAAGYTNNAVYLEFKVQFR